MKKQLYLHRSFCSLSPLTLNCETPSINSVRRQESNNKWCGVMAKQGCVFVMYIVKCLYIKTIFNIFFQIFSPPIFIFLGKTVFVQSIWTHTSNNDHSRSRGQTHMLHVVHFRGGQVLTALAVADIVTLHSQTGTSAHAVTMLSLISQIWTCQ